MLVTAHCAALYVLDKLKSYTPRRDNTELGFEYVEVGEGSCVSIQVRINYKYPKHSIWFNCDDDFDIYMTHFDFTHTPCKIYTYWLDAYPSDSTITWEQVADLFEEISHEPR